MNKSLFTLIFLACFSAISAQVPRLSLHEEFTGETCPPCAQSDVTFDAVMSIPSNAEKIVSIKWMVPIPSAPSPTWSLYKTNKTEIDWRYGPSPQRYGYTTQNTNTTTPTNGITSAPMSQLDGQDQRMFGAAGNHVLYVNAAVIDSAHSFSSPFSVVMAKSWNQAMTAMTITVNIVAAQDFNAVGALVFRAVMIEKTVNFPVSPAPNVTDETIYRNPVIASFPNIQTGTSLPATWVTGQSQIFTLTCVVPAYARDINEVDMVGFIQDDGNQKVEQTVRASDCVHTPLSISAPQFICSGETATLTAMGGATYSWSTGQIGNSIVVPAADINYWVKSTAPQSCPNIAAVATKSSACTGISSPDKTLSIHIYPNPSKGEFVVKGNSENTTIIIYDLLGKKVFEQKLNAEETQIKTNLSKGIYTYNIIQSSAVILSDKLVVE